MNARLIYWTLNSKQEAFFLDNDIKFHSVLKDNERVVGREEAECRLAELRPHHKLVWVDTPEMLHRIAVEMKTDERDLDARPLLQIAAIVQSATPQWHPLNQQARFITKLTEQYEQGQINQPRLLHKLRETLNRHEKNEYGQSSQLQNFALFLCELANSQLD